MGRILGIDYGSTRIGLALSDPTGCIASPFEVWPADTALKAFARLCREQAVERVVVGLPLHMDGGEGPAAALARAFAEKLRAALTVPVELWDERWTTLSAQQALIEGGVRRRERKGLVDKIAAQIMLQHYLDSRTPPAEYEPYDDREPPEDRR